MKKLFIFSFMLLVFLVPLALSEGLEIKSLKVYVDGDKDSGTIDADPESEISIEFDIENTFDKLLNIEITDIEVIAVIEKIDDGDELEPEDDPDVNDLDAGDDDSVELEYTIPLYVDEDTYELEIKVEGRLPNGTLVQAESVFKTIKIDKEKHNVWIRKAELYSPIIKCGRSTQLDVKIINMGTSDEDDTVLTVTNEELEISARDQFDLDRDPFDSDSRYSNSYTIVVPKEVDAGTYPISIKVTYDDGGKTTEEIVELEVECEEEETTTVVETPDTTETPEITGKVVAADGGDGILSSLQSVIGNKGIFALVLLVELAVIIVGIILVISWVKKKQ